MVLDRPNLFELFEEFAPDDLQALFRHQRKISRLDGFFKGEPPREHLANIVAVGIRITLADNNRSEEFMGLFLGYAELLERLAVF
jgi:hypothetical protein